MLCNINSNFESNLCRLITKISFVRVSVSIGHGRFYIVTFDIPRRLRVSSVIVERTVWTTNESVFEKFPVYAVYVFGDRLKSYFTKVIFKRQICLHAVFF